MRGGDKSVSVSLRSSRVKSRGVGRGNKGMESGRI